MKNKIIFSTSVFLSLLLLYIFIFWQKSQIENHYEFKTSQIHSEIQQAFAQFLNSILAKGVVTTEYFSEEGIQNSNYRNNADKIMKEFKQILGLNLLDATGRIVDIHPVKSNKLSLGKISQNYLPILDSWKDNHSFWLSPPFQLFQGPQGFALYIPITKEEQLKGWLAVVVALDLFFKEFVNEEYSKEYHLVIQDKETSLNYFPKDSINIPHNAFSKEVQLRNRTLLFISWPIENQSALGSLFWLLSASLIFTAIISYFFYRHL